jgi:HAE1 family hydrophobic/amphiphilic exporter-1
MTLTELSIKRPILIIVLFLFFIVLGIFGYTQLRYELLPNIASPAVTIITNYPGASPADVETSITKPIEEAVSTLNKIKRISSASSEGISSIAIEFQQSADADVCVQDAQRKVNEVLAQLPQGIKPPTVLRFSLADLPIMRISATSTLSDARDMRLLMNDQIKPRLAQLQGVGQIELIGGEEREIRMNIDPNKLRAYNLSMGSVVQSIQSANADIPAGIIVSSERAVSVRLAGKFNSVEQLRALAILTTPEGSTVRVKDIAMIEDGMKDVSNINRLNGTIAIGMLINKQADANAVAVSALVRNEMQKMQTEFTQTGLQFDVASDASVFTLEAAHDVNIDLLLAIGLVALVMLVFLHSLRDPLIVSVSIPTSLAVTYFGMWAMGFSLNLMTLLAMSLVIGILVDDSIVVLENIHRHLAMKKSKVQASLDGRNEIGFSALSITLVDVVVFVPIAIVPGMVGSILREFALVMVISTMTSLLVCFTLTPMLASRFAMYHDPEDTAYIQSFWGRFATVFERGFSAIVRVYERVLAWSLRHRITTIALALLSVVGSLGLVAGGYIGGEFVSSSDRSELSVFVELPPGTPLDRTNEVMLNIEESLRQDPVVQRDLAKMFVNVGAPPDAFSAGERNGVEMTLSLVPKDKRHAPSSVFIHHVKECIHRYPDVKVRVAAIGILGTANDAPIILTVTGTERDSVRRAMLQLRSIVENTQGTQDIRLSSGNDRAEIRADIDHRMMALLGVAPDMVSVTLRTALTGDDQTKLRLSTTQGMKEFPVRIQMNNDTRSRIETLGLLTVPNAQGHPIQLQQFVRFQEALAPSKLERKNRNNSATLYAQIEGRSVGEVSGEIQGKIATTRFPAGTRIGFEGDVEMMEESFIKLGVALGTAILFVYLIMVALYNSWVYPFVVLFSVPVAIVGALIALALAHQTLNLFSILGVIMLVGLVTKNAILLVDRTNQNRTEFGLDTISALMEAGRSRLRPIVMTTVAMVAGMIPIAIASGAGAEWKNSLAWVLIGGLTSSMVWTLVLVPAVYVVLDRMRSNVLAWFATPPKQVV